MHRGYRYVLRAPCPVEPRPLNAHILEDAPAPSALHRFKAEVKDGKILVTADPSATLSANKSRPPTLLATGSDVAAGQGKGVVIVGGGSGAFMCIESLREVRNPRRLSLTLGLMNHGASTGTRVRLLSCPRSPTPRLTGQFNRLLFAPLV